LVFPFCFTKNISLYPFVKVFKRTPFNKLDKLLFSPYLREALHKRGKNIGNYVAYYRVSTKARQATLLIAKLDRLSRNPGFIFTLRDSGADFVCVDMPEANTLTIGIFAVLAQHERELISQRTRAALSAKKEQGFKLGSPHNLTEAARQKGLETRRQNALSNKANRQASRLVRIYREQGYTFQQIADEFNGEGYLTRNGKPFRKGTVHYLYGKGAGGGSQRQEPPAL
jgi:hypothetical protein